jgi:hypothetical protein
VALANKPSPGHPDDDDENGECGADAACVRHGMPAEGGANRLPLRRFADRGQHAGEQTLWKRHHLVAPLGEQAQQFSVPCKLGLASQAPLDVRDEFGTRLAAGVELSFDFAGDLGAVERGELEVPST